MRTVIGIMGKLGVGWLSTVNIGYIFFQKKKKKPHFLLNLHFFFSFPVLIFLLDGDAGIFLGMFT
jgi:hypothetical protein